MSYRHLLDLTGLACAYCPRPADSRDHILPRERGRGLSRLGVRNLRPACKRCNEMRGVLFHCPALLAIFHLMKAAAIKERQGGVSDRQMLIAFGIVKERHGCRQKKPRPSTAFAGSAAPTLGDVWPTPGRARVAAYLEGLGL